MKIGSIKILFVVLLCMFAVGTFAQQTITMNNSTNNTTVNMTGCSATLYDSGGPNGSYSSYEDYTITVCVPSGYPMEIDVNMTTENTSWDYMNIYEGSGTTGTVIANRIGSSSSGTQYTNSYSLNSSCATFTWHTDGSGQYAVLHLPFPCVQRSHL